MSYPTKYQRQYDYVSYQNANPTRPLPATSIHADLNAVALSLQETIDFISASLRADGAIMNGAVGFDQLSTDVKATIGDTTSVDTILAAAAQSSADAATATTQAASATTAATNASTSAASASTSATSASTSATNAAASATVVVGDQYAFATSTTMADPATGFLRFNNATLSSVTALAVSASTNAAGNPNIRTYLSTWGSGTNTDRGTIEVRKIGTPSTFAIFKVTSAVTDNGTWEQVTVAFVAGSGTFSANDALSVRFSRAGDSGSGVSSVNGATGAVVAYFPPQGRLTLVSGTPVMTTSQSAATTVYYTSAVGDLVPLYDGTNFVPTVFTELSIALGSNWAANSNYDVFVINDSGTLRAVTGPAWTSDTGRGTGAGTTELVAIRGLYFNNVSMTGRYANASTVAVSAQRALYVGTIRTGASTGIVNYIFGTTVANWGAGDFGVWNAYNRVYVSTTTGEATAGGWTYTVANTWRAANGNATARVSFIRGLDTDVAIATYTGATNPGAGTVTAIGVGLDTTTALTPNSRNQFSNLTGNAVPMVARYSGYPGIGRHYFSANEIQNTTTSSSYYATGGLAFVQTGMQVELWQ